MKSLPLKKKKRKKRRVHMSTLIACAMRLWDLFIIFKKKPNGKEEKRGRYCTCVLWMKSMTLSSPISQTKQKPLISSFKFQVSSFNNWNSLSSLNGHSLQPNPKCQRHSLSHSSFVITTPHLSFITISLTTTTFPVQVLSLSLTIYIVGFVLSRMIS